MATILFVSAVGGHGGPVASLRDILPAFEGHRRVCAGAWVEGYRGPIAERCEEVVRLERPRGPRRALQMAGQLRALVRRLRPDVVFANGLTEVSIVAVALTGAGRRGKIPIWTWVHNYEIPTIARLARRWVRRKDVRWRAVSVLASQLVIEGGFTDEAPIIGNPIDTTQILAERVPAPDGRVRVAYLGTDRAYKGFQYLPGIIERTRDLPLHWALYMGRGRVSRWPWLMAMERDPELRVEARNRVSPVSRVYATADIVIVPSVQESFCRVVTESMANGIPIVASDLHPIRQLAGDEAAILCPVGDEACFAEALRRLVLDPDLRAQLGARGRERSKPFDVNIIRERWRRDVEASLRT